MAFTTYEYYKNTYYGESVAEESFPKWLSRATDELNYLTLNRIDDTLLATYSDQIQKATCALIDILVENENIKNSSSNGMVKSKSSGNESISYGDVNDKNLVLNEFNVIKRYLAETGLLFQGLR